ncbi:MAG: HU family DNA-binding protein [Clostridium sp.]|nr:HU family DNA-binding protein [Clostridium sp.]
MDKKILLQELADGLVRRRGLARKDAELFVRTVFDIVSQYLESDKAVKVKGLGTFKIIQVNSRESVNVNTGERFRIDGHAKITFVPDSVLKDEVNKPFIHFETVVINSNTSIEEMERMDVMAEISSDSETLSDSDIESDAGSEVVQDKDDFPMEDSLENVPVSVDVESEIGIPDQNESEVEKCEQETDEMVLGKEETFVNEDKTVSLANDQEDDTLETGDSTEESAVTSAPTTIVDTEQPECEEENTLNVEQEESRLQVDYQRVETQHVDDLNVTSQRVEHQTIENQHIVQPVKNAGAGRYLRLSLWGVLGLLILILMLMLGSYYAGYYGVLCPPCMYENMVKSPVSGQTKEIPAPAIVATLADTSKVKSPDENRKSAGDSLIQVPVVKDSVPSKTDDKILSANVLKESRKSTERMGEKNKDNDTYRQLPGGKYTIVGTRGTVEVKAGQTLRGIALSEYGSKDYVSYIVVHNGIANPDRVEAGRILKLPELKLKGQ